MTHRDIHDCVTDDSPGSREIGFSLSDDYNASETLFRNLEQGHGNVVALKSVIIPGDAMTQELQSFVKKRLLPLNSPRLVEYVDELPKTGTGKIDRQQRLNYTS